MENYAHVRLAGIREPRRIGRQGGFFHCPRCTFRARVVIEIQVWDVCLPEPNNIDSRYRYTVKNA